ncbi:hypothetical protein [Rubidibacter lacunae]|uniref:hypothetical protein n=1 Tax=Rubidibacter lacunae TaxID=582514 RepID=UPI0012EC34F3|nr:hypothetical protein [Rubidibacter lacunae]
MATNFSVELFDLNINAMLSVLICQHAGDADSNNRQQQESIEDSCAKQEQSARKEQTNYTRDRWGSSGLLERRNVIHIVQAKHALTIALDSIEIPKK